MERVSAPASGVNNGFIVEGGSLLSSQSVKLKGQRLKLANGLELALLSY